jgi:predicted exporter
MLFSFNIFWKVIFSLIATWGVYGLVGFELTVVSLLSLILVQQVGDNKK